MKGAPEREALAVLALGANLGEPMRQLREGAAFLCRGLSDPRVSSVYRSAPEGGADQPPYLNAVMCGGWAGTPEGLLAYASEAERRAGRTRPGPGAARTLDVDVLFLGATVMSGPELVIPHPRWSRRAFVVLPLLEVLPEWVDPQTGIRVEDVAHGAGWVPGDLERVGDLEMGDVS